MKKLKVNLPIADGTTSSWLEEKTGKKLVYGQKPTMLDLADEIVSDEETPVDVLLAIIGKRIINDADTREWTAFKWLCGHIGLNVDQALEIRVFIDTHW